MPEQNAVNADDFIVEQPLRRVVSLVPSFTESLFDLGLGETVVGITDYCVHPAEALEGIARVGGTKNPNIDAILRLKPDLVLANKEENSRPTVESIQAAHIPVWVSFPCTVREALGMLRKLAGIFHSRTALQRIEMLETAVEWELNVAIGRRKRRYFCPIWHDQTPEGSLWWMTFNRQTYPADVLALFGGENIFDQRVRRYPLQADLGIAPAQPAGERDTRYPRIILEEVLTADPELILLPNEPYAFDSHDRAFLIEQLGETQAVRNQQVYLVDGSLITWHGTRLARALQILPQLFLSTNLTS